MKRVGRGMGSKVLDRSDFEDFREGGRQRIRVQGSTRSTFVEVRSLERESRS